MQFISQHTKNKTKMNPLITTPIIGASIFGLISLYSNRGNINAKTLGKSLLTGAIIGLLIGVIGEQLQIRHDKKQAK